jgi:hypothetical protein
MITKAAIESLNEDLKLADSQEGDYLFALESAAETVSGWVSNLEADEATGDPNYYWDLMSDYDENDAVDIVTPYGDDTARIISQKDGGVIAYVHKDNANRFTAALQLAG